MGKLMLFFFFFCCYVFCDQCLFRLFWVVCCVVCRCEALGDAGWFGNWTRFVFCALCAYGMSLFELRYYPGRCCCFFFFSFIFLPVVAISVVGALGVDLFEDFFFVVTVEQVDDGPV